MRILSMLPAAKGVYPPEAEERRFNLIKSYATPCTTIDVRYMPGVSGFSPWGSKGDDLLNRDAPLIARANGFSAELAQQAQKEGYDAFCPFGTLDIGIEEARSAGVGIPVVGQAEASILYAGMLGRRFASCSYISSPSGEEMIRRRVEKLGLLHLYVGPTAIGLPNSEYPSHREEVLSRYGDCAAQAKKMGAEIMGLVAMSICPTEFSAADLGDATGLPVIDALAAQVTMAEWWHRMGLTADLLAVPRSPHPA